MKSARAYPASPRDQRWFEAARLTAKADEAANRNSSGLRDGVALHGEALEEWRALGDRQREMRTLARMGVLHSELGERQKALAEYEASLAIARQIGDVRFEWLATYNIATEYGTLGEQRKAVEALRPMLETARRKHLTAAAFSTRTSRQRLCTAWRVWRWHRGSSRTR